MNAADARRLTAEANTVDGTKVRIALEVWHRAIEKAARAARSSVRGLECERVRTPIPATAVRAALEQLRADGFKVRTVDVGPCEIDVEVSW